MRIAVCDDDPQILLDISSQLVLYQEQRQSEVFFKSFRTAIDLFESMKYEEYDVLFLDILMPGVNGIEAAREIRQKNEKIKIVFLTSSPEYAVESYSVQASNYLLKPVTQECLFSVLDQIADILKKPEDALIIRTKGRVFCLPYKKIEFIEVISKTLYFYLTDGSIQKVYGSLSDYEAVLLARPCFCKIHRSYLVNLIWVTEVHQKKLITASGRRVPVARSSYQQVRTAYMEFLFEDAKMSYNNGGTI